MKTLEFGEYFRRSGQLSFRLANWFALSFCISWLDGYAITIMVGPFSISWTRAKDPVPDYCMRCGGEGHRYTSKKCPKLKAWLKES